MSEHSEGTPPLPEVDFPSEAVVPSNSVEANFTGLDVTAAAERESPLGGERVNSSNIEALLTGNLTFELNDAQEMSVSPQQHAHNAIGIQAPLGYQERNLRNATRNESYDDFDLESLRIFEDNIETNQYNEEPTSQSLNHAVNDDITSDLIDFDNDSVLGNTRMDSTSSEPHEFEDILDSIFAGPTDAHTDEVPAITRREVDSGDSIHIASAPLGREGHIGLPLRVERSALAPTSMVGDDNIANMIQSISNIAVGAGSDGISSEVSTTTNQEPRTKSDRYQHIGRGPQVCGNCGAPRKGHNCPFKQWNQEDQEESKKIRTEWLAAVFYGFSGGLGPQESVVLRDELASREPLQSSRESAGLIEHLDVAGRPASRTENERHSESERSDTVAMRSNQTNQGTHNKSERYRNRGRGPQNCGLCGKLRKSHPCIFTLTSSESKGEFLENKIAEVLAIGLYLWGKMNTNIQDTRNNNNENQSEAMESEVRGQESRDKMENSESGKKKRQRKK
ncbi:hypothetical protein HJC23_005802 [Cyclotella cryptica]|uniref:Uncharacterized protein n=1 Tax=Cyclotella cryptica TaxID=29204 RepID=A0ABD3QZ87_9STRA